MDLPPEFLNRSGLVSLLPQYLSSEAMYERFLNATQNEEKEIQRAFNAKGLKTIDSHEVINDNLNYFYDNKSALEDEFYEELIRSLGEKKANLFCEIISKHWFDGRLEREGRQVIRTMAGVKKYLIEYRNVNKHEVRVLKDMVGRARPIFNENEIEDILEINKSMVYAHISKWLEGHKNYLEMSLSDIHVRRGLFLDKAFEDKDEYVEGQYINSYSLAFTVTEKFSQMRPSATPVIVNAPYDIIKDRILFFSPFIKGMPPQQLEFGIIPNWKREIIRDQGAFGGIREYIIE